MNIMLLIYYTILLCWYEFGLTFVWPTICRAITINRIDYNTNLTIATWGASNLDYKNRL